MKKKTGKIISNMIKILALTLVVFFLLICVLQIYLLTWGGDRIKTEIQSRVKSGSDGLYAFDAENIATSLFGTSIIFTNASLTPDTIRYRELAKTNEADRRLYYIKVPELKISGINIIKFLNQREFRSRSLKIQNPRVKVVDHPEVTPVKEDPKAKFTLYALFAPGLSAFYIKSIEINRGNFQMIEAPAFKDILLHLENINTKISGVLIDSTNNETGDKLFTADELELSVEKALNTFSNGMYHLTADNLTFSSNKKVLSLVNIELEPQVGKFEFAHRFGHETDRINLLIDSISVYNISVIELLQSYVLNAERVKIRKMNLHALRDKRLKLAPVYRKLPQEIIRELPLPLKIDTLELYAERISYEEFPDKGDKAGNLFFTNINGKIYDITNKTDNYSGETKINASGFVYGKGETNTQFIFDVFNKNNEFTFSGTLGEIDPLTFNEMSIPVAGVEIKSGFINKMEFNGGANSRIAEGAMKLYYEDLKLQIFDQESGKEKEIQTFLANIFKVKNSNPDKGNLREGKMKFERDTRKSITNFCWKTILSGMKSSIGMSEYISNEDE